jgi:hypothetical protein
MTKLRFEWLVSYDNAYQETQHMYIWQKLRFASCDARLSILAKSPNRQNRDKRES